MVTTNTSVIKQIKGTNNVPYELNAKYWNGYEVDDLMGVIHGVVDTYVIDAKTNGDANYKAVVEATTSQISTTQSVLKGLVKTPPTGDFKVGDIILMGATSDGKMNFDRWISSVGTGTNPTITLDVLETQVATHHHTFGISTTTQKALTSVSETTTTKSNVATVGTAVANVLTGTSGDVVTSVSYDDKGSHNLDISVSTSGASSAGHSHSIDKHSHTITFKPTTLVSTTADVVNSLSTSTTTPHSHTVVSAAGIPQNSNQITYVTGGSTSDFIISLKDSNNNTTTSTDLTTNDIPEKTVTSESGSHSHTLSSAQTDDVVTAVTVAPSVITDVTFNYSAPSLASTVVTSVVKNQVSLVTSAALSGTTSFISSWGASVDKDGVLSFSANSSSVGIAVSTSLIDTVGDVITSSQTQGSASLTPIKESQSVSTGKVSVSGTIANAGSHTHGFSHTHTINGHTHTYVKTVKDQTGAAYTTLSTSNYTPHTHNASVSVASIATDGNQITYVTGGGKTTVVGTMISTDKSFTTTEVSLTTDSKYYKLDGTITFPGLSVGSKTLSTTSITPASDMGEKAIKAITFTSANVIKTVTSGDSIKTSKNVGGE